MYNLLPRLIKKVKKLGSIFLFRNSSFTDVKLNCVQKYHIFSVVDVKEAIEEKPAAEEESRQMKQAVVQSVSMSVALSITSCDTLALSGLLFENCAGQSASSLFIDSSSSVSLTTPIASSFSRPSQSTQKMEQTSSSAGQQVKKTITVTGLGSARSLMVMQSTAQSFAHLTDGSLSLTSLGFTETASQIGVSRQKSFFDVKGGSLRPECVEFVPPSFSGTSSFVKMSGAWILSLKSVFISRESFSSGDVVMKSVSISTAGMTGSHEVFLEGQVVGAVISDDWTNSINTTNIGPLGYHLYPHTNGAVFMSEGFWDHGKCGQERLHCSSLDFAFSLLTHTKTEISLGSNITLSTLLECPETGASISSSSEASLLFESDGQIIVEVGSLTLSSIDITLPSSLSQSLLVVKGSTLTLSSTVTITTPPSAAHTASLFKIEGGRLALSGTVFDFAVRFSSSSSLLTQTGGNIELSTIALSSLTLTSASMITMEGASTMYTESGGGAFLSTNGNNNQIVSITNCSFESVSSEGDGGVILAQLGAGSKLTVADTTFKLYSSSGKGGALSIVLSSTGSFAVEAGTSFESCSAIMSGSAVFVEAQSLASAITKTSMTFLSPFPLTPTAAPVDMHRGWNTVNSSDDIPLVLFLADVRSTGFASSSGSDGELCGFSVNPCSSIDLVQTRLAANDSKTEGKLNPITLELQTALDQSTPFSCGGHKAMITGNTITLSKTDQTSHFSVVGEDCGFWLNNQEWRCRHSCRVWIGFGRAVGTEWDEHDEIGVPFLLALRCDIWDSEDRIRNGTDSLNHTTDIISVRSEWRIDSLLDSLKWIVQISSTQLKARQIKARN
ncbi:hypothetical protein BLNAU_21138 [Blattamonas nauphoetae]|uniref:Uncharacterized protein n=1 Tax=Blattamonas nauphoetae TaxID=2049346 RepID=A0ABQ9WWS9_9EUKA|nr:hypothetical protein BLNAU_21138 [Blattamonas nauphoetae]